MATFLARVGSFCYRRRKFVLVSWLVALALLVAAAATLSKPSSNNFSLPGTEAQKAINLLGKRFPQLSAQGATAQVVFAAPHGQTLTSGSDRAAVEKVVAKLKVAPQVALVVDPFQGRTINQTGTIGYAQVTYQKPAIGLTTKAQDALKAAVLPGRSAGLTVEIGGDALTSIPKVGASDLTGILIAAVVLAITFGSLVAAGLPLLTAIFGVGVTMTLITAASGFVDVMSATPVLAVMIGLAVAIDYALLIVSRYRHEIGIGKKPDEAIGMALGTAGSTVVFAGLTVIIALCGMIALNISALYTMGLFAALGVAVAVLIALTLLPALLGFAGRRILAGHIPGLRARDAEAEGAKPALGHRWGRLVTRRPAWFLLAGAILLVGLAIPAVGLRMALPDNGTAAPNTTQRKAYDLVARGFGPGFNGPLAVVVEGGTGGSAKAAATTVSAAIAKLGDVAMVTPPMLNQAGDTAVLNVVPKQGPTSQSTNDLVKAIRHQSSEFQRTTGAEVLVTGKTALDIDVSNRLNSALLPYLLIVVGLAFLLLTFVFRSLVVPLMASLGFILSVMATLGVIVAVFQKGWLGGLFGIVDQPGPVMSLMPTLLIGIVFGLAMDYQVFLVTRIREEYVHGAEPTEAVITGLTHASRVIFAAALIMISVFIGFGLFASDQMITLVGLGLACAVLLDAFVVRMTLVPAVMTLLGHNAWWLPRWLERTLPDVDIEGKVLRADHGAEAGVPQPGLESA
jgi:putative drug exporter of the RND superfamily